METIKDEDPMVSVVIPTLNSEKVLPLCLESVKGHDYPEGKEKTLVDGYGVKVIKYL